MHFVLPYLKVRQKIGFGTRGFGGLLDNEFFIPDGEIHNFDLILKVLKPMGIRGSLETVEPYFVHPNQSPAQLWTKLSRPVPAQKPILICPESGNEIRMLSIDYWCQLAAQLLLEPGFPGIYRAEGLYHGPLSARTGDNPAEADRLCLPWVR